jgi:SAM-dependent methyltransferase
MPLPISVVENHNQYFASGLYDKRYPLQNPTTLATVVREIGAQGHRVLDGGCGSGRYAEALLDQTAATIFACDISREAVSEALDFEFAIADKTLEPLTSNTRRSIINKIPPQYSYMFINPRSCHRQVSYSTQLDASDLKSGLHIYPSKRSLDVTTQVGASGRQQCFE